MLRSMADVSLSDGLRITSATRTRQGATSRSDARVGKPIHAGDDIISTVPPNPLENQVGYISVEPCPAKQPLILEPCPANNP